MFAINRAIQDILFEIPPQVLRIAFIETFSRYRHSHVSLEDQIESLVIRPRVLVDCNLIGGVDAYIALDRVPREDVDAYQSVFRIPKSLTNGRSIVVAKNVMFLDPNNFYLLGGTKSCGRSSLATGAENVMNAAADIPYVGTHRLTIIAENTVLVRGSTLVPGSSQMLVTLSYDENLNDLSPRSIPDFTYACLLATKAYIYTNLNVALGEGRLQGGVDLGEIKDVVQEYADANELYREYRKDVLAKILFMNDDVKYESFIKNMIGGPR